MVVGHDVKPAHALKTDTPQRKRGLIVGFCHLQQDCKFVTCFSFKYNSVRLCAWIVPFFFLNLIGLVVKLSHWLTYFDSSNLVT